MGWGHGSYAAGMPVISPPKPGRLAPRPLGTGWQRRDGGGGGSGSRSGSEPREIHSFWPLNVKLIYLA